MVSHELRTPLVLLVGLSEMMLRERMGDRPPAPPLAVAHLSPRPGENSRQCPTIGQLGARRAGS